MTIECGSWHEEGREEKARQVLDYIGKILEFTSAFDLRWRVEVVRSEGWEEIARNNREPVGIKFTDQKQQYTHGLRIVITTGNEVKA